MTQFVKFRQILLLMLHLLQCAWMCVRGEHACLVTMLSTTQHPATFCITLKSPLFTQHNAAFM